MKKAYLLVYSGDLGTREQVKGYLSSMDEITHWRYDIPHSFYVISEANAVVLARRLRELSGGKGRFVFTELADNKYGWLTPSSWYLINNKEYKPKT